MKSLRKTIQDGDVVIGSWISSGSPVVAELMAQAGFDYLCVDVEHSPVDLPQAQQLFQAIRSGDRNCFSTVRLHGIDYALVKRYVDAGAQGIIAPLVRSREDVETLVRAVRYPPIGLRGVGFCRANGYGVKLSEQFERANDEVALILQIEHIDAVKNIDQILNSEEVDAAFIGPYDLSASMGLTGQFEHPDYLAAIDLILGACKRHKKTAGIHVVALEPKQVEQRIEEGYSLIAYSLDITFLTTQCRDDLEKLKHVRKIKLANLIEK
jgi:2-dehydro-3-deoxyglucarate aldolase